ncbi:DUF2509 family protein [Candidatus Sodalis endolongispinus]|uniref:DUF2509 family protein n=1 Tax=Candidatus Sodalis endolongispinus TaxID=2812662 RepID=A0ABS5YAU5_9GAMM|nr:DUF2509 family protein [Candidatus Sodalis endolongispinus]MBT9432094.1 DUF2509 family protein [Candidatus Sodalis endolongispinus]
MNRERGSGSVLALLLLSAFCLLAMLSWQQLLQVSLELIRAQRHYLRAFHQAESSLAWWLSQNWPARHGECRLHPDEPLRVCLQASQRGYGWLLCGEGGGTIMAPPLRHYQRVTLHQARTHPTTGGRTAADHTAPTGNDALALAPVPAAGWIWPCLGGGAGRSKKMAEWHKQDGGARDRDVR